jgi:hypothetical protein
VRRVEPTERTEPTEPDDADALDLEAVERDLDEVERTLERLADGTYWSAEDAAGATAAEGDAHDIDESPARLD